MSAKRSHPAKVFLKRPKQTWKGYFREMMVTVPFVVAKVRTYGIRYYLSPQYYRTIKNRQDNKRKKAIYGSGYLSRRREIKERLIELYGARCRICRHNFEREHLTIDHVTPRRNGGSNRMNNLQLLCRDCHNKKDENFRDVGNDRWGNFAFKAAFEKIQSEEKLPAEASSTR